MYPNLPLLFPILHSFDGQSGGLGIAEGRGRRNQRRVPEDSGGEWDETTSESADDKEEYEDEEFG